MITENQLISADIILYYIFKTVISFSCHRQKIPTVKISVIRICKVSKVQSGHKLWDSVHY